MGRTMSKIFGEIESYEDLKNTAFQYLIDGHHCYMNDDLLQASITALTAADERQQRKILRYARHIDRKLSSAGTAHGNIYHKLPAFLTGSIFLVYHAEDIEDLSLDELTLLARYSAFDTPEQLKPTIHHFGKELLGAITEKHFDYMFQWTFLDYAESKLQQGITKEEVAKYIREIPIDKLKEEAFEYERESLQERIGSYLWK